MRSLLSSLVGNSTRTCGASGHGSTRETYLQKTTLQSSATTLLYITMHDAASSSLGQKVGQGNSRRGTCFSDSISNFYSEECLIDIFLGTKAPEMALSNVGRVRGAEGMARMGGGKVTNRTSSRPPTKTGRE